MFLRPAQRSGRFCESKSDAISPGTPDSSPDGSRSGRGHISPGADARVWR
jgi:hypothetical protein